MTFKIKDQYNEFTEKILKQHNEYESKYQNQEKTSLYRLKE